MERPAQATKAASGQATGPSSRERVSPRRSSHASNSAAAATTAYMGTSRFASVEPTWTWIRAAMQASTTNGSTNGQRRTTNAPAAASSRPKTASPPSKGRCPCGAR